MINFQHYKTPVGELIIASYDNQLCMCDWRYRTMRERIDSRITKALGASFVNQRDDIIDNTIKQLEEYFDYKRQTFSIPLLLLGTDFQKSVWNGLLKIPFGKTSSYLQLAESVGNKKAVRAVANANGANAISIIIPCHRIIGNNGNLVGYAGGLKAKEKLLGLECDLFTDTYA